MPLTYPLTSIKYRNSSNPGDTNVFNYWLRNSMYGTDAHVHIDISNTLDTAMVKLSFFVDPGVDKNDALLIPVVTPPPVYPFMMPQTTTYKSCIDGGVRTIVHALHAPESPMMSRIGVALGFAGTMLVPMLRDAYFFRTSENVAPNNPLPKSAVKMRGLVEGHTLDFTQFARIGKRMLKLRLKKNWTETMDSIRYVKSLETEQPTKFKVIRTQSDFNSNFPDLVSSGTISPTDEKLRCFLQLEGLHCMDFEKYRLPDHFSKDDPTADDYGGFLKSSDSDTNKLTIEVAKERINTLVDEGVKVIVIKHFYWCGISGAGRSIPPGKTGAGNPEVPSFAHLLFPLQDEHMKYRHTFRSIKNNFTYLDNTHHTELGRQLVKEILRNGVIVDLKHSHYESRKQIFEMMENGFDINPLYNDHGNPVVDVNGNIVPFSVSADEIENLNTKRSGSTNNKYQVMVSHAGLTFCFRDDAENTTAGIKSKTERDAHNADTMGIYNEEIVRIAKLGGVIGLISEDRVSRRHYEGKDFRMADDKEYPLIGEDFIWPSSSLPTSVQETSFGNNLLGELQDLLDEIFAEMQLKYDGSQYPAYHYTSKINKYYTQRQRLANAGMNAFYESFKTVVQYSAKAYDGITLTQLQAEYPNAQYPTLPLGLTYSTAGEQALLKYLLSYRHVAIASDFDGMTDALEVYTSPRLMPAILFYTVNRLKYDLAFTVFEEPTHPLYHSTFAATEAQLDAIVKEIIIMFLYKNFHYQVAKAQAWI